MTRSHQVSPHIAFWSAMAFLGWLQISAAVLNLLPIPGLDGYAIIEPYLDPATVNSMEKVKPWGMLGVIVLLNVQALNQRFFQLINYLYDLSGASPFLRANGAALFRFWNR